MLTYADKRCGEAKCIRLLWAATNEELILCDIEVTYADVCWHMRTYADVSGRMLTYAGAPRARGCRPLSQARVRIHMASADVC